MKKGINPRNPHQARVFFCMSAAYEVFGSGMTPWKIMDVLEHEHGFRRIGWTAQTVVDGIDIWIEYEGDYPDDLPSYLRDVPWRAVGSA